MVSRARLGLAVAVGLTLAAGTASAALLPGGGPGTGLAGLAQGVLPSQPPAPLRGLLPGAPAPAATTPAPTVPATATPAVTTPGTGPATAPGTLATRPAPAAGTWHATATVVGGTSSSTVLLQVGGVTVGRATVPARATRTVESVALVRDGGAFTVHSDAAAGGAPTVTGLTLAPAAPQLTIAGPQVLAADGTPTQLRGVNTSGFDTSATGWHADAATADAIRGWGANTVRVPVSEAFWNSGNCVSDATYPDRVTSYVRQLTARGMLAIIDLHTSGAGLPWCVGAPRQQKMADTAALGFWHQVAAKFAGDPLVAFDLYNEPHDITVGVWRNGGHVDTYTAAGMQQMYDTVRAAGATNAVFVSGINWASDTTVARTAPLDGYGIVYAAHRYDWPTCGGVSPAISHDWDIAAADVPVVITEFGSNCGSGSATYDASVIAAAQQRGMGWIAFNFGVGGPGGMALLQDWNFNPTASGIEVRRAMAGGAALR
ncbi:MAG: Endoglucanase precursor [Mycobacterium sp.]|nr:Endoglucanase precursor [Mycobacterium sp.]